MSALAPLSLDWIWSVLWSVFRIGGFFVLAPFWGNRVIPTKVRIPVVMALALVVGPVVGSFGPVDPGSLWRVFAWGVREIVVGGLIGFCFASLFWGVRMAGDLISLQMGFAIVNAIDPSSAAQVSLIGEFKYIIAILILVGLDGHHLMIGALVDSYRVIPVGAGVIGTDLFNSLLRLSATVFVTAIKIAAPVMITLLLTDVALGIVSRTVPQMNIFIIGFPLKIGVGLFMIGASMPIVMQVFGRTFTEIQESTQRIIAALAHV